MITVGKLEKPLQGERGRVVGVHFKVDAATFEGDIGGHFNPSVILIPT